MDNKKNKTIDGVRYLHPNLWQEISLDKAKGHIYYRWINANAKWITEWECHKLYKRDGYYYFYENGAMLYLTKFSRGFVTWEDWKIEHCF